MSLDLSLKDIMSKHRMLWNYISEYYAVYEAGICVMVDENGKPMLYNRG